MSSHSHVYTSNFPIQLSGKCKQYSLSFQSQSSECNAWSVVRFPNRISLSPSLYSNHIFTWDLSSDENSGKSIGMIGTWVPSSSFHFRATRKKRNSFIDSKMNICNESDQCIAAFCQDDLASKSEVNQSLRQQFFSLTLRTQLCERQPHSLDFVVVCTDQFCFLVAFVCFSNSEPSRERETSRWHRRQASMWHYRKRRCTSPFSIRSFLSPYATVLVSTTVGSKFFLAVSFFCLFFIERKWSNTHTRRQESESMNSTRSADKQREREKETIPWPNDRETKWQLLYQDVGARLL